MAPRFGIGTNDSISKPAKEAVGIDDDDDDDDDELLLLLTPKLGNHAKLLFSVVAPTRFMVLLFDRIRRNILSTFLLIRSYKPDVITGLAQPGMSGCDTTPISGVVLSTSIPHILLLLTPPPPGAHIVLFSFDASRSEGSNK